MVNKSDKDLLEEFIINKKRQRGRFVCLIYLIFHNE